MQQQNLLLDFSLVFTVYFSKLTLRTQIPIYESTPPVFFWAILEIWDMSSPNQPAVFWDTGTRQGALSQRMQLLGEGPVKRLSMFCGLFSYTQFCYGEFLCVGCLDGRWWNMNSRSPENSFSYYFLFPMPLCFQRESMFEVHVSIHHKPHCIWPQHSEIGGHPGPLFQSSPTHGVYLLHSFRGYITSVQIFSVIDNSLIHRTVQLIIWIIQFISVTDIKGLLYMSGISQRW